jgi:holliday junction DNA helicase RuvA
MYAFLKGILDSKTENTCLVDVNGVGYEVYMPASDLGRLPTLGEPVTIHTWHVQREDVQQLYGFVNASDRKLFKLLLGVASVGPKSALAILSGLKQEEIEQAVMHQDANRFAKIPGIGRKTAERLLLELKDKMKSVTTDIPMVSGSEREAMGEAMEALLTLGYPNTQARAALQKVVDQDLPPVKENQDRVAEFVRRALKRL